MFYSPNYFCETIPQGQSRPRLAMKRAKSLAERDPSQNALPRHSQQPSEPNNEVFGPTSQLLCVTVIHRMTSESSPSVRGHKSRCQCRHQTVCSDADTGSPVGFIKNSFKGSIVGRLLEQWQSAHTHLPHSRFPVKKKLPTPFPPQASC
jgi:hypothetical protein